MNRILRVIPRERHSWLLRRERILQEKEFEMILKTSAIKLRESGEIFLGRYFGFDDKRGNILIWFPADSPLPRKGEPLVTFIPMPELANPANWGSVTYEKLRGSAQYTAEFSPVWFQSTDKGPKPGFIFGFKGATEDFVKSMVTKAIICFGPMEPPVEYLENLYHLTRQIDGGTSSGKILDISLNNKTWYPEPIPTDGNGILKVQTGLALHGFAVVQGPPGTGKTHLTANLCALFLKQGKRVLVTALTNRALIELACKEPLKYDIERNKVYKTNLSEDEKREVKGLAEGKDYEFADGTLLLQTYYLMTGNAVKSTSPPFDVVIVEEASQAFLATVAAAKELGQNLLLVGDPAQLPPIMVAQTEISKEDPNSLRFAKNGLSTICDYYGDKAEFILTQSRRLPERAVRLTNHFYEGMLTSKALLLPPFIYNLPDDITLYLHKDGGTTVLPLPLPKGDRSPIEGIAQMVSVVKSLQEAHPELHISVLSHYKASVRALQKKIYANVQGDNILVDTISRIQGLTTDICLYLIVNDGLYFQTQEPVFNVVTSRARRNTIIVCPSDLLSISTLPLNVKAFLQEAIV